MLAITHRSFTFAALREWLIDSPGTFGSVHNSSLVERPVSHFNEVGGVGNVENMAIYPLRSTD
jgi:hypothetical protein